MFINDARQRRFTILACGGSAWFLPSGFSEWVGADDLGRDVGLGSHPWVALGLARSGWL
jgi:hypothetical protein